MLTRILRRLAIVVAVLIVTVEPCAAAYAAGAIGSVDCRQNSADPSCTVHVGESGAPGTPGDAATSECHAPSGAVVPCYRPGEGWLADDGCYYQLATGADLQAANATDGAAPPSQQWYVGSCDFPPYSGQTRFRPFGAAAAPDPRVLAAQAVAQLRLPAPVVRLNPAPPARQLVYVPMWLWLDASSWGTRSATASVPGLSVTATATADRLVLSTGDGATVVCRGAGTAWTTGTDPGAASPTCGHTYVTAGPTRLTATVTWEVAWAGGGTAGMVPALTTTATQTVQVAESQALNDGERG